jgi:hypothetical protein
MLTQVVLTSALDDPVSKNFVSKPMLENPT